MTADHIERIAALKAYVIAPIADEDHLASAVRKLILNRYITLLESESGCRTDKNPDSLLRMIRATSDLQGFIGLVEPYLPPKTVRRLHKRLRKLHERLEDVRELDVMIRDLLHYGESLSNRMMVAGIVAQLDAQRLVARERLISYLNGDKYAQLHDIIERLVVKPLEDAFTLRADETNYQPECVAHVLPVILQKQVANIRAVTPFIEDRKTDMEVYDLLRGRVRHHAQTIACFEAVLGTSAGAYLGTVHGMLARLDRLHDINCILNRLLHLPRVSLTSEQVAALKQYRQNLRMRREKKWAAFPECWDQFNQRKTHGQLMDSLLELI